MCQRKAPGVDILIRAKHNRNIKEAPFKLFAAVRQSPVQGRIQVPIPKQSARTKKSKQKARAVRPKRSSTAISIRAKLFIDKSLQYFSVRLRFKDQAPNLVFEPGINHQLGHTREFTCVVRDQWQFKRKRVRRNPHSVTPD